jgi:MFS family permease
VEEARRHYGVTLALLTIAGISFAVMQTLVVPALPYFQREFDTTASWATWIATGFLLSSSVLTPILGKLGDSYGKKRMLVISLGIFGLASLGAAAAWDLPSLIVFRVVQGAGAAVFPLSFGIIRDEFPPEKVGLGIGTVSSVFGVGGGVGLVLSGVIIEHLTWHWLFLIGAVPVLVATVLLALYVPESPVKFPARPDYVGGATLSLALGALLVAISEGTNWGWTSAGVLGLLAFSAVMFTLCPSRSSTCGRSPAARWPPPTSRRCSWASPCSRPSSCCRTSYPSRSGSRPRSGSGSTTASAPLRSRSACSSSPPRWR